MIHYLTCTVVGLFTLILLWISYHYMFVKNLIGEDELDAGAYLTCFVLYCIGVGLTLLMSNAIGTTIIGLFK